MKMAPRDLLTLCRALPFALLILSQAAAQSLQWDTDIITPGAQGATITQGWTAGPYWWNGTNNVTWTNGSDATFGGTPGVVNDAAITVDDITFTVPGYVLQPSGPDFGLKLAGGEGGHVITVAGTATINHRLLGTDGFTKEGTGTLSLGAPNQSFTGTITINAGEVKIGGGFADPEVAVVLANTVGAKLTIDQQGQIIGRLSGGGATGGEVQINGSLTLGDNTSATYDGVIAGNGGFTKTGSGTLTLTNAKSSYSAPTLIEEGIVSVSDFADNGILSSLGLGGLIKVGNGATLRQIGPLPSSTDRRLEFIGSGNFEVQSPNSVVTWNGRINGDSIQKSGSGTLVLSGSNTFTGSTLVSAGTLRVTSGNALPDFGAVTLAAGAVLDLANSNESIGNLSGSGNILLGSGSLHTYPVGDNNTYSGTISGTGTFEKAGPGRLTLSGANTFTGPIHVSDGFLSVTGTVSSTSVILGDATHSGTFSYKFAEPPFILTGPLTVSAGGGIISGNVRIQGPIVGTGELYARGEQLVGDKDFAGVIHFTSTFSGLSSTVSTNLPNATLIINDGDLYTSGSLTFGQVQFRGRNLFLGPPQSPSSISTIHTSSLLLSGSRAGRISMNIASATSYDSFEVTGPVTLDYVYLSLSLSYNPQDNVDVIRLIVNDGSDPTTLINGGFVFGTRLLGEGEFFTVGSGVNSQSFQIRYGLDSTDNDVRLIAVPEPSSRSLVLGVVVAASFGFRHRRRIVAPQ